MKKKYISPSVTAVRIAVPVSLCQTSETLNVYDKDESQRDPDDEDDPIDGDGYYIGPFY